MKPTADFVVVNANEVLTIAGYSQHPVRHPTVESLGLIREGAVASFRGRIVWVGRSSNLGESINVTNAKVLDARGKVVMPGLVDSHTHCVFAGTREDELDMKLRGLGYMEILKKGGGILKTVRATRTASIEQIVKETRLRLLSMLSHGSTTVEVKTGYGLDLDSELKLLDAVRELQIHWPGKIVQTFLGAHALPPEFDSATMYTDFIVERMLPSVADTKLAEFCDVFCEPDVFGIQDSKRILEKAHALGMHPKIHADEFQRIGATTLAVELGATSADHLLQSTDEDIALLSKSETVATFLPSTPFCSLLDNYANARRFIDSGCAVALASDISPNAWCESMQLVIQLAVLKMKMRVHEAIVAATINGAHAIRRAREVGSLEVGKRADALVMNVPNHKFLAYQLGTNLADVVITNGKVVSQGAKLAA